MRTAAIVCNILLFAFTGVVLATDGAPRGLPYLAFTLLLLAVPLLSAVAIARGKGPGGRPGPDRLAAAACNVLLLGFACWALVSANPHPEEQGVIPFMVLVVLTPILSLVALLPPPSEMSRLHSIYDSSRLAAKYAHDRPPVHPHLIRAIGAHLGLATRVARALDIGCGAGLSTAALEPLAESAVGLEPVRVMVAQGHAVAPSARFVVGRAERLPFPTTSFDVMTAAGSLNYADLGLFLPEAARVLAPGGVLAIYDFSAARRLRRSARLEEWFSTFERTYPFPPDYDLDVKGLAYGGAGLRLEAYEEFEVAVAMTLGSYLPYALSETNVEAAILRGVPEAEIRDWCRRTLSPVFGDDTLDVLFECYVAYVRRATEVP